jgi:hypothetical protein
MIAFCCWSIRQCPQKCKNCAHPTLDESSGLRYIGGQKKVMRLIGPDFGKNQTHINPDAVRKYASINKKRKTHACDDL